MAEKVRAKVPAETLMETGKMQANVQQTTKPRNNFRQHINFGGKLAMALPAERKSNVKDDDYRFHCSFIYLISRLKMADFKGRYYFI